jgi:hypothetical protein
LTDDCTTGTAASRFAEKAGSFAEHCDVNWRPLNKRGSFWDADGSGYTVSSMPPHVAPLYCPLGSDSGVVGDTTTQ